MKKDLHNTIKDTYTPLGSKIGTETEHLIADQSGQGLPVEAAEQFAQALANDNTEHSREIFASVFETKTKAYEKGDLQALFIESAKSQQALSSIAQHMGHILYALPFFPEMSLQEALALRIRHPRADGLLSHLAMLHKDIIVEHCVMTTGIHVSVGYESLDEALHICQLAAMLVPLLTMMTENPSSPNRHMMAYRRHGQGKRTDVQDYFFTADTGQDLLEHHLKHITSVPAMMFVDAEGQAQVFADPDRDSFDDLPRTLQTAENFFLIEKMQYNDVKLAAIKDVQENIIGHRVEIRMADRGPYQHDFMVLVALMLADQCGRELLCAYLSDCGYQAQDPDIVMLLQADLQKVIMYHGQRFAVSGRRGDSYGAMAGSFLNMLESFVEGHYPQYIKQSQHVTAQIRPLLV